MIIQYIQFLLFILEYGRKGGLTEEEDLLFPSRGKVGRVEAEAQAFSILPLLHNHLLKWQQLRLQELSLALVELWLASCILICGSAIAKRMQISVR